MLLREATPDDYELMLAWRSDPDIYQGFYQQTEPLKWEEHIEWLNSRNNDWRTYMVVNDNRRIGVVTIGQLDHWSPEVGYYIGEKSLWGRGYGTEAVGLGLEAVKGFGRVNCHTTVLKNNKASLALLVRLGFSILGDAREGELWLTKRLS